MAITGFGFHLCKGRDWYWIFTNLNHLIILISVRLTPTIAKHACNNGSYSTERQKRYSALRGITGPEVNLQSGNTSKTIQPSSSFMGEYLGCSLAGLRFLGKNIRSFDLSTARCWKLKCRSLPRLVPALHLSQKYLWWSWKSLLYPRVAAVTGHTASYESTKENLKSTREHFRLPLHSFNTYSSIVSIFP